MEDQNMELQNLKKPKNYSILDSESIQKLTLKLIKRGKKKQVLTIFKDIMELLKKNNSKKNNLLSLIDKALINVQPFIQLKTLKRGNTSIQVPTLVTQKQQQNLAIKWLINAANKRNDKDFSNKFVKELTDASNHQGNAVNFKVDLHKTALNQKRFLYFRK